MDEVVPKPTNAQIIKIILSEMIEINWVRYVYNFYIIVIYY